MATPAIDALRADSILFTRAYSHVPLTLPSHASILTGLLPADHQVRDNLGYRLDLTDRPSLPRLLRESGYATGAAISAYVLRGSTGMANDFDFFEDQIDVRSGVSIGGLQRPGVETLEASRSWLESVKDRPFFFFFHIYEPHTPHAPSEPFASRYKDAYDGEVAAADAVIGKLVELLESFDVYDRAIIVFLSDHGEGLYDHGTLEHMVLLNREIVQVPLMLKLPNSAKGGTTVTQPAQLIDILPTMLDLLGKLGDFRQLPGTSLLRLSAETPPRKIFSETHYPRLHFGWSQMASLTDGRYHYIHGPEPELFDLEIDPAETNNILRQERRVYGEMKAEIERYDLEIQSPSEVDPEAQEKLAALGYLGSVAGETAGPLADPKTKLHVLEALKRSRRAASSGDFETSVTILQSVVTEEPLLTDAWSEMGKDLAQLDRLDEAEAAIREAMRLSSGAPSVALNAAEIYQKMGRLEDAKAHAELAKDTHEVAWDLLAQIALAEGDLATAEILVEEAVERRGTRVGPVLTKATLRVSQDRLEEALELTELAEREAASQNDPAQLKGMYFTRGKAYAMMGESQKAKAAFLAEIEQNPDALGPYTHLAFLYALEGNGPEAGRTLQRMVETNPSPAAHAAAVLALREMGDLASAGAVLQMALRRWPQDESLLELSN